MVALVAPGMALDGVIVGETTLNGRDAWLVKLNVLPDQPFAIVDTSLPYRGSRQPRAEAAPPRSPVLPSTPVQEESEDPDFLEDAVAEPGEPGPMEEEVEEGTIDRTWREGRVEVDCRAAQPSAAFRGSTVLHLSAKEYASPAQYFLRFLPETHIQDVVLNAINEHAASVISNFVPVTYAEYLVWIALFVIMTTVRIDDHAAYWHRGNYPFYMSINFSDYMTMESFNIRTKMHVFVEPSAQM